jgi:hypothetical protein
MSMNDFDEARQTALEHEGHMIELTWYGLADKTAKDPRVYNVAFQCEDCGVILMDWDNPAIGGANVRVSTVTKGR